MRKRQYATHPKKLIKPLKVYNV